MKHYVFLANGFEDLEALSVIDIMRRAGLDVVTSAHNVLWWQIFYLQK